MLVIFPIANWAWVLFNCVHVFCGPKCVLLLVMNVLMLLSVVFILFIYLFFLILFVIFLILIIFIYFLVLVLLSPNCVFFSSYSCSFPSFIHGLLVHVCVFPCHVHPLPNFNCVNVLLVLIVFFPWHPPSPCPFHFINCMKVNKNFIATHITTCILVATLCLTNFWTFNMMPKFTILYLGRWAHKPTWKLKWNWSLASLTMIADKIDMKFALAHFVNLHRFELLA